jgi:flavin-dependent dehydrogenase
MLFLGTKRRIVAGDSYMVAGDSAGLIEFFSGNGIPQAISSGRIAGETAILAIENQNFSAGFLSDYEDKLYHKIKLNYAGGRVVLPLLHRPYYSKLVLKFLNFLSGRPQTNAMLRDLLYEKNPGKILRKPGFYYKLFFKREAVG